MRAAIFTENDGPLSVEDMSAIDPGPRDVVVRVTASGLCHSDLSVINGTLPMPPPCILGHEGAGIVVDVGPGVKSLKKGDQVTLVGFGTFLVRERAARTGRNPRTGDEIKIAAQKVPAFKAGKALKDAVN